MQIQNLLRSVAIAGLFTVPAMSAQVGMNLTFPWAINDRAFVDLIAYAGDFFEATENVHGGYSWSGEAVLQATPEGYPLQWRQGTKPRLRIGAHNYPAGTYDFYYQGKGSFRFDVRATAVQTVSVGHARITVVPESEGMQEIHIFIDSTDTSDPLRNFHLIEPGYAATWQNQLFRPDFLSRNEKFDMLRFMDWHMTNGSNWKYWNQRHTRGHLGWGEWGGSGVPLEVLIQLCNTLGADGWFNIPHLADDQFIRQFAIMLRDSLDDSLSLYIEYSNETWNSAPGFEQNWEVLPLADSVGITGQDWEKTWRWTAHRSGEIFAIFEEVFGANAMGTRVIRVLPTQTGGGGPTSAMLEWRLNGNLVCKNADALAIAPYFGRNQSRFQSGIPLDDFLDTVLLEDILHPWEGTYTGREGVMHWVQDTKSAISSSDCDHLNLVMYEGGQHYVDYEGTAAGDYWMALNRHPGMYGIYQNYLDTLDKAGIAMITLYASVSPYSGASSFGHLEYPDQPIEQAHKMRAILDWIDGHSEPVRLRSRFSVGLSKIRKWAAKFNLLGQRLP